MQQLEVISILKKDLNFNDRSIEKLKKFAIENTNDGLRILEKNFQN